MLLDRAEHLYGTICRARAGRPILARFSGPEARSLSARCELVGADPSEVVLAVTEAYPTSRAASVWGTVSPPTWFVTGPRAIPIWKGWKAGRQELYLLAADTRPYAALLAEVADSEYRISLVQTQGIPRADVTQALMAVGLVCPAWVLSHDREAEPWIESYPLHGDLAELIQRRDRDPALARELRNLGMSR